MELVPLSEEPKPAPVPQPQFVLQPPPDEGAPSQPVEESPQPIDMPENIKRLVSLSFTLLAALLYGAILGGAIIKNLVNNSAVFTDGALRATQILSGLVGTVVTAGFARAKRANVAAANQGQTSSILPRWLIQSKLLGLADTLGLNLRGLVNGGEISPLEDEPIRITKINTATWVAGIYFVIYFLVGAGAFVITVLRPAVPEIISNSAWVWLGTLISSSYAFFALGEENAPV